MIKLFGKELNLEEIFVGTCIQFPFYYLVGWWVLVLMPVSGILWALGGAANSNKLFRRLGVPVATSLAVALTNPGWWWIAVFVPVGWLVKSIGYGIPDGEDDGSVLGKFWKKILKNQRLTDFAVRLTTYIIYWIAFGVVAYLLGVLRVLPL